MKTRLSILTTAAFLTLVTAAIASIRPETETLPPTGAALPSSLVASLADNPVHPDEPLSTTLTQRFSFNNALSRIQQINQALDSFRQLTNLSRDMKAIASVGNTDPETQTLGFHNWVSSVEGTVRQQDYQLKRLEFELAQKQFEDGEISKTVLDEKALAFQSAKKNFQTFMKSFSIAD
ncbi:MAG: hypothetical protein KME16_25530 [Scytolyngbya sp. HA4215-MV1]|jgi:hypothetical protein|nr:hypothetical protein [Scytolyngbya sp. HA4215-MV1]